MASISTAAEAIKLLEAATAFPSRDVPGAVFLVINRDGHAIFSHAAGLRSLSDPQTPMTVDTTFWLASFTKAIVGIAAMQLYEQGKLDLNSADQLEEVFPEGKMARIIEGFDMEGKPVFREKNNRMTTRMLLTHTSGYSHDFFSEKILGLNKYLEKQEGYVKPNHPLDRPLIFEPGTDFCYGEGMDAVGAIVERISGLRLDDYFKKHIFEPAGIKNISFYLNDEMEKSLADIHARLPSGDLIAIPEHPLNPTKERPKGGVDGGGGKIFGEVGSYAEMLAILLNNGISPKTGNRILKSETLDYMFENHLGPVSPERMRPPPSIVPTVMNTFKSWSSAPEPHWWGLSFLVTGSEVDGGRGKGTAEWAGLANSYWWCDRKKGIAGVYASQVLPFQDVKIVSLYASLEKTIYSGLQQK